MSFHFPDFKKNTIKKLLQSSLQNQTFQFDEVLMTDSVKSEELFFKEDNIEVKTEEIWQATNTETLENAVNESLDIKSIEIKKKVGTAMVIKIHSTA